MSSTISSKNPDANPALTVQDSTSKLDAKKATVIALAAGIFAVLIVGGAIAAYGAIHLGQTGVEPLKFAAKIISENPLSYSISCAVGSVVLGTALACALYRKKSEPSIGSATATTRESQTSTRTSSSTTTPASGAAQTPLTPSTSIIPQPIVTTAVGVTSSDANPVLIQVPSGTSSNVISPNVISSSASRTSSSKKPPLAFQEGRRKGLNQGKLLANALNALFNQNKVSVAKPIVASTASAVTNSSSSSSTVSTGAQITIPTP